MIQLPEIALSSSKPEVLVARIREIIEHVRHYLPTQGPISVFVHHNTLHCLEHLPFDQAVQQGAQDFHAEPYLSEDRYHHEMKSGRISAADVEAELMLDLGDEYDRLISVFGTRFLLRQSMLQHRINYATGAALKWTLEETAVMKEFQASTPITHKRLALENLRLQISESVTAVTSKLPPEIAAQVESKELTSFSETQLTSLYLNLLWQVCLENVCRSAHSTKRRPVPARLRDHVYQETGRDPDQLVHEQLVKFCSSFIDQGFANFALPDSDRGFAKTFAALYLQPFSILPTWMKRMVSKLREVSESQWNAVDSIIESMARLNLAPEDFERYLKETLLALPGWAGMVWQLESNVPWAPHTLPPGSLDEFLAIRLLLDEAAAEYLRDLHGNRNAATTLKLLDQTETLSIDVREETAFVIFQLAQLRGWDALHLLTLSSKDWNALIYEVRSFDQIQRRRILHAAYERSYRQSALKAFASHSSKKWKSHQTRPKNTFCLSGCHLY